jgi:hypothetical protein
MIRVIKTRMMRLEWNMAHMGGQESVQVFCVKARKKETKRKMSYVQEKSKMNIRGKVWGNIDWVHLAEDKDQLGPVFK